ncbi:MAG: hypothetical protein KDA60_08575 [Planctomycetales bacterium]|nr:hypothetical protein [Planctomycetales bacterium]
MRLLSRSFTLVVAFSAALQLAFAMQAHGQEIDLVPFGATYDVLFTLYNDGGTIQAANPTLKANGDSNDAFTFPGTYELWAGPEYDTNQPVNAVLVDSNTEVQLNWIQDVPDPFFYETINYFANAANNVPPGTDLFAVSGLTAAGLNEGNADTQKYTMLYTRHEFNVENATDIAFIEALQDDGAVFFIDGLEVGRFNCCAGDAFTDFASSTGNEDALSSIQLDLTNIGGTLTAGPHVFGYLNKSINGTSSDVGAYTRMFTSTVENQWNGAAGTGRFDTVGNWTLAVPDGVGGRAVFGSQPGTAADAPTSVFTSGAVTVGEMVFDSTRSYAISGLGTLTLEASAGESANVSVVRGNHDIQIITSLASNTDVTVTAGSLQFNNDVLLNGFTMSTSGNVAFNNYVDTAGGAINAAAGAMTGSGTIAGDVNNRATVSPGDGIGMLTITGNFTQDEDGRLLIEVGGRDDYDRLNVQGDLTAGGILQVSLANGFIPALGDRFDVMDFSTLGGSFDVQLPNLPGSLAWNTGELYSLGSLSVVPEPATSLMCVLGALVLGALRRRR